MTALTHFDRIHRRTLGSMPLAEEAQLEHALAADPLLRRFREEYALVFALTACAGEVGAASTTVETLDGRLAGDTRSPWARRVAAAVLILSLTGASFWIGRLTAAPRERPVALLEIELDPSSSPSFSPDLPAEWLGFDPRGTSGVRFLRDLAQAEELARLAGRPLLVYGSYPGCPMCAALDANVFSNPDVVDLAERVVPVRINLAQLPEPEQRALTARGYPFLEMWRASGETTHALARSPDPGTFLESLHDGLERSGATGEQPAWADLRAGTERFAAARTAERAGRMAEAEAAFQALAERAHPTDALTERAQAGLTRLANLARESLVEARALSERDLNAARELLSQARARFAGTRFERDLANVLQRLEQDGRFPRLVEADGSV